MGVLGLSLEDARHLSIKDITHALAWRRYDRRDLFEMARMMAFYFVQPYDSKKKIKKPSDLFKFPYEEVAAAELMTPEAIAAREAMFAKWDAQMKTDA